MKRTASVLALVFVGTFSLQVYAGDGHNHGSKKHCEKKVDGKTVHLDHVKTRKECKQEGGRWVKHKKKDDHADHKGHDHGDHKGHDHKEGDGHKH